MPTTNELWTDLTEHDGLDRTACVEPKGEYNSVAFDKAQIERLAEKVAMRADYPEPDKECRAVVRKIAAECGWNFEGIVMAYGELERSAFFVETSRKNPPRFQIRQVVAQYKRRGKKRSWISPEYESVVTK